MQDHGRPETALQEDVRALRDEVRRLNEQRYFRIESSLLQVAFWNVIRGIAWGFGSVLGATILISFLLRMLGSIDFIPILGDWAQQIIQQIEQTPPDAKPE